MKMNEDEVDVVVFIYKKYYLYNSIHIMFY